MTAKLHYSQIVGWVEQTALAVGLRSLALKATIADCRIVFIRFALTHQEFARA